MANLDAFVFILLHLQERIHLWNKLKLQYEEELAAKTPLPIKITLPDGKVTEGQSWRTTPYEVAKGIRYGRNFKVLKSFYLIHTHTYIFEALFLLNNRCTRGWYIRLNICAGSINKWTLISLVAVTPITCYLHCTSTGNLE